MQAQNYKNHARIVPLYHGGLTLLLVVSLVFSIWNMYRAYEHHSGRLVAAVLLMFCIAFLLIEWYARAFAIAAQDRAIRAEENLRHFVLTGKLLDSRLSKQQVIALRFAEDTEFILLAERAAKENMNSKDIKMAIVNWKADHHRA